MTGATQRKYDMFVHSAIDEYHLNAIEFRVYCHIARSGQCRRSAKTIAQLCECSERSVWLAVRLLTRAGLILECKEAGRPTIRQITKNPAQWAPKTQLKQIRAEIRSGWKKSPKKPTKKAEAGTIQRLVWVCTFLLGLLHIERKTSAHLTMTCKEEVTPSVEGTSEKEVTPTHTLSPQRVSPRDEGVCVNASAGRFLPEQYLTYANTNNGSIRIPRVWAKKAKKTGEWDDLVDQFFKGESEEELSDVERYRRYKQREKQREELRRNASPNHQ